MKSVVCFIALFGITMSLECNKCLEMKASSETTDVTAFNTQFEKTNIACESSSEKETCTNTNDVCENIDLAFSTPQNSVSYTLKKRGCMAKRKSEDACTAIKAEYIKNYKGAEFTTCTVAQTENKDKGTGDKDKEALVCDKCEQIKFIGEGADAMNKLLGDQADSCSTTTKQTCNAAKGEDKCRTAQVEMSLEGDFMGSKVKVSLDMTAKGCMSSTVTCDWLEKEAEKSSNIGSDDVKYKLKSCKIDGKSGSTRVYSGIVIIIAIILSQLF